MLPAVRTLCPVTEHRPPSPNSRSLSPISRQLTPSRLPVPRRSTCSAAFIAPAESSCSRPHRSVVGGGFANPASDSLGTYTANGTTFHIVSPQRSLHSTYGSVRTATTSGEARPSLMPSLAPCASHPAASQNTVSLLTMALCRDEAEFENELECYLAAMAASTERLDVPNEAGKAKGEIMAAVKRFAKVLERMEKGVERRVVRVSEIYGKQTEAGSEMEKKFVQLLDVVRNTKAEVEKCQKELGELKQAGKGGRERLRSWGRCIGCGVQGSMSPV